MHTSQQEENFRLLDGSHAPSLPPPPPSMHSCDLVHCVSFCLVAADLGFCVRWTLQTSLWGSETRFFFFLSIAWSTL